MWRTVSLKSRWFDGRMDLLIDLRVWIFMCGVIHTNAVNPSKALHPRQTRNRVMRGFKAFALILTFVLFNSAQAQQAFDFVGMHLILLWSGLALCVIMGAGLVLSLLFAVFLCSVGS